MICCCTSGPQMYSIGGISGASFPAAVVTADKSDMTSEVTSAVSSANLPSAQLSCASGANPGTAGYVCGGRATLAGSDLNTGNKTTYSNDTTSAVSAANLTVSREQIGGLSERSTKCYFVGGLTGVGVADATQEKLTFSSDTTSAITALGTATKFPAGLTEGTSKGYWAGGYITTVGTVVTTGYKLTFSTDTAATQASANLSAARFGIYTGSDGSTKGYWAGGQNGAPMATVDLMTFSTDTTSLSGLSFSRDQGASGSDGNKLVGLGDAAFDASGLKITFATSTSASFGGSGGNLSVGRRNLSGVTTVGL